jgi:hypothetical protein
MAEIKKAVGSGSGEVGGMGHVNGKELNNTVDDGHEGEKERNLSKAALSIAELGDRDFQHVFFWDTDYRISVTTGRFDSSVEFTGELLS